MASNAFNIAMVMRADVSNAKAGVTDLATAMRGFTADSEKAGSVTKVKAQDLEKLARAAANAALSQEDLAASERRAADARARAAAVPLNVFANPGSAQPTTALINTVVADMTKGAAAANQAWRSAETSVASCQTAVLGLNNSIGAQAHEMVEASAATQRHQATMDSLRASFSPMFAALLQYERQLDRIDLALKSNVISEAEASAAVAEAARERARAGQIGSGAGASSFYAGNIAAQGFDVGVTAAMGMSPAMIGLQQGTQLAQVAQSMGGGMTAIKGIGAGLLSIINPLSLVTIGFTALAAVGIQALMKIWPATKTTSEVLDEMAGSVDRVKEAMSAARRSMLDLGKEFGDGADDAKRLLDVMTEIELRTATKKSDDAVKNVFSELGGAWNYSGGRRDYLQRMLGERSLAGRIIATPENSPQTFRVDTALNEMNAARETGDLAKQIAAAQQLVSVFDEAAKASGKVTDEENTWLEQLSEMVLGLQRIKALKENAAGKTEAEEIFKVTQQQLQIAQAQLQFGEDSGEVRKLENAQAVENLKLRLQGLGIDENSLEGRKALNALIGLQYEAERKIKAEKEEQAQVRQDGIDALTRELSLLGSSSAAQIRTNALAEAEIEIRKEKLGLMEAEERRAAAIASAEAGIALERGKAVRDLQTASIMDGYDLRNGLAHDPRIRADIAAEREYVSEIRDGADPAQARAEADRVRASALNDLTIAQDQFLRSQGEAIQRQQVELALIGQSAEVRARVLALMEAEQQIQQNGASGDMADTMRRNALEQVAYNLEIERGADAWAKVQSAGEGAIDAILGRIKSGDLGGALEAFAGEIEKTFFELGVMNPMKNALMGTNLGTMADVGGLGGIWDRLTGKAPRVDETQLAKAGAMPIQSMAVTAANVTLAGNLSGIGAGIGFANTNAAPYSGSANLGGSADVQKQVWQFFSGKGLQPHQVAAIMGQVSAESSFNPLAVGDNGTSFGLFQHHAGRGQGLLNAVGGRAGLGNVDAQLDYVWKELLGSENGVLKRLMATTNVRDATAAAVGFERPQGWTSANPYGAHNFDGRLGAAEAAMIKFGNAAETATTDLGTLGNGMGLFGNALQGFAQGGGQGALSGLLGGLGQIAASALGIPGFASGGNHKGGLRIVGENGPELEATGPSRIFNAAQTRDILSPRAQPMAASAIVSVDTRPMIQIVNNSSAQISGEVEETTDAAGRRQFRLIASDLVADGLSAKGGKAQKVMRSYGASPAIRRRPG